MKATVSVTIGKHTSFDVVYDIVRTRAPIAYDYGYVLRLGDLDMGDERIVAIPEQYTEDQSSRYASGLYFGAKVEDLSDEAVLDSITSKLFRE